MNFLFTLEAETSPIILLKLKKFLYIIYLRIYRNPDTRDLHATPNNLYQFWGLR